MLHQTVCLHFNIMLTVCSAPNTNSRYSKLVLSCYADRLFRKGSLDIGWRRFHSGYAGCHLLRISMPRDKMGEVAYGLFIPNKYHTHRIFLCFQRALWYRDWIYWHLFTQEVVQQFANESVLSNQLPNSYNTGNFRRWLAPSGSVQLGKISW